jgi:hypothetical protein
MRRFFDNLYNRVRQSNKSRATRRGPRRVSLGLEGLESRLVPTTATLTSGVLNISNVAPGHAIELTCSPNNNNEIEVYDISNSAAVVFQANKQTINTIDIRLGSNGGLSIDDSNGMPFAANTLVSISGTGTGNALGIGGSRTVTGNETYVPGSGSSAAKLTVDGSTIDFTSTIGAFTDYLPITGTYDVQASGTNVTLGTNNGTLTGLSAGAGGGLLNFANKPTVELDENAANATIHLNGVDGNSQSLFEVNMHGAGDSTVIAATAIGEVTEVQTNIAPVANPASVILEANSSPVEVNGNSSTTLTIGRKLSNGLYSTSGIQANVTVEGLANLTVLDNGNDSTAQNVTVTEKSISGTGLFGKNGVVLSYGGVANLSIDSGQLADQYTVEGSNQFAVFDTKISITDFSSASFRADVYVNLFNYYNLSFFNASPLSAAELFIHPEGAGVVSDPGSPQGVADVTFAGSFLSQIFYDGFTPVVVPA